MELVEIHSKINLFGHGLVYSYWEIIEQVIKIAIGWKIQIIRKIYGLLHFSNFGFGVTGGSRTQNIKRIPTTIQLCQNVYFKADSEWIFVQET